MAPLRLLDSHKRPIWLAPAIVGAASTVALISAMWFLREVIRAPLHAGYLFQSWNSETMMQTIAISDLVEAGPTALWYLHINPPMLDGVRYVLVLPEILSGSTIQIPMVDERLYVFNAILYGITNAFLYTWIRDATHNGWWALVSTAVFAAAPGYLMAMQLLETTPMSVAFGTASFYYLYRFLKTRDFANFTLFMLALLLLSYVRNTVQIHGFVLLGIALVGFWFYSRKRSHLLLVCTLGLFALMLALPVKQALLFGSFDVSSVSGYHRVGMLGLDPRGIDLEALPSDVSNNANSFVSQLNTPEQVQDNINLTRAANEALLTDPISSLKGLTNSASLTFPEMLRPTSTYVEDNLFVNALPYRGVYDWLDSGWRLLALLILVMLLYLRLNPFGSVARHLKTYWPLLLFYGLVGAPVLWSNRYWPGREELGPIWTDTVRLKILVAAPLFVFAALVIWSAVVRVLSRATSLKALHQNVEERQS